MKGLFFQQCETTIDLSPVQWTEDYPKRHLGLTWTISSKLYLINETGLHIFYVYCWWQLADLRVLLAAGSGLGYQHNSFVDVKSGSTQRALCRPTNQTELVEWMITISYTENSFQICGSFALSRPQQPKTPRGQPWISHHSGHPRHLQQHIIKNTFRCGRGPPGLVTIRAVIESNQYWNQCILILGHSPICSCTYFTTKYILTCS